MKKLALTVLLSMASLANAGIVPCDKASYDAAKTIANANGFPWKSSMAQCKADENVGYVIIYADYENRGNPNALVAIFKTNTNRLQYRRGVFDAFCAVQQNGAWNNVGKTCPQ